MLSIRANSPTSRRTLTNNDMCSPSVGVRAPAFSCLEEAPEFGFIAAVNTGREDTGRLYDHVPLAPSALDYNSIIFHGEQQFIASAPERCADEIGFTGTHSCRLLSMACDTAMYIE